MAFWHLQFRAPQMSWISQTRFGKLKSFNSWTHFFWLDIQFKMVSFNFNFLSFWVSFFHLLLIFLLFSVEGTKNEANENPVTVLTDSNFATFTKEGFWLVDLYLFFNFLIWKFIDEYYYYFVYLTNIIILVMRLGVDIAKN